LKNAHLRRCAANRTAQRMKIYASRFGFLRALHLNIFEQPHVPYFLKQDFNNNDLISIKYYRTKFNEQFFQTGILRLHILIIQQENSMGNNTSLINLNDLTKPANTLIEKYI
jgi:hypothetical protein